MTTDLADAMAVSLRPVLRAADVLAGDARSALPRPTDAPRAVADGPTADRILVVGSGPAVGWGVVSHELGLPGALARSLRAASGRGALVDLKADERWSAHDIADRLRQASLGRYDAAVVVLGDTDVLAGQTSRAWRDGLHELLAAWRETGGAASHLLIVEIPRLDAAPGLQGAVQSWAARRAQEFNAILHERVASEPGVTVVRLPETLALRPDGWARGDYAFLGTLIAAGLVDELDLAAGEPVERRPALESADAARNELLVLSLAEHRARLEWIVTVAASAFKAPTALVTVLGPDRQWHVARTGYPSESLPIEDSFCLYAVELDEPLIVLDASGDPRFADNPLVTGPTGVRFYAGAAIEGADGRPVGALCVLDREARAGVTAAERQLLLSLARRAQDVVWAAERELAIAS